jgi:hypothetical protein
MNLGIHVIMLKSSVIRFPGSVYEPSGFETQIYESVSVHASF